LELTERPAGVDRGPRTDSETDVETTLRIIGAKKKKALSKKEAVRQYSFVRRGEAGNTKRIIQRDNVR